jgi:glycosyltransferase involved in cell wall biosynthesis
MFTNSLLQFFLNPYSFILIFLKITFFSFLIEHITHGLYLFANTSKHFFDTKNIPDTVKRKLTFYDVFVNTDLKISKLIENLLFSQLPYNAERFIFENFKAKIEDLLKKNKYDIVQFEGLYVLPYIEIVRKNSAAKIAYRAHNIEHEIWQRTLAQTSNLIKKYYIRILTSRLKKFEESYINKYDFLIPITHRDAKKLEELGNNKPFVVIPTGVREDIYNTENQEVESKTLFHIGALDWTPNQEGLLWFLENCWDKILSKDENIKFYIAGRNAPKWFVEKLNKRNIIYLGEVDDAKKFISSKQIMIVPLLAGSGMRIKIIEGMALQKAIITTSVGIEGIDAQNKKEVYIADTADEFIANVLELTSNKQIADKIAENAKKFVSENFNNTVIAKKLFDFYAQKISN